MLCCVSSFFPYPRRLDVTASKIHSTPALGREEVIMSLRQTLVLAAGFRRLAKIPVTVKCMLMAGFTDTSLPCYLSDRNLSPDRGANSEETQDRLLHMLAEIDQQLVGGFKAD